MTTVMLGSDSERCRRYSAEKGKGEQGMSLYTCVHRPRCKRYPETEIPEGDEEWVEFADPRQVATHQRSHHKDCISGLHYVRRDGKRVSPYFVNADLAWVWLLKYQPHSVDWALKWEGYAFGQVPSE